MAFVPADPQGLGSRAMVGKHRVKLIQRGASDFTAEFRGPLAAFEVMYDDVEAQRAKMEQAGFKVLHERTMKSGRKAYYRSEGRRVGKECVSKFKSRWSRDH